MGHFDTLQQMQNSLLRVIYLYKNSIENASFLSLKYLHPHFLFLDLSF